MALVDHIISLFLDPHGGNNLGSVGTFVDLKQP